MRLIDVQPVLDYSHNKNIRVCTVDLLEALPVVDAVPVVRGEWVPYKPDYPSGNSHGNYACSICGGRTYSYISINLFSFCPNCGARMDGEKHE